MRFWFVIVFNCISLSVSSNTPCTTPNGEAATCTSLTSCPALKKILTSNDRSLKKFLDASSSSCPPTQTSKTYCCGSHQNFINGHNKGSPGSSAPNLSCTTPNGEAATCTSLFSCPTLQKSFTSNDPSAKKFVEDSVCQEGTLMVCCGSHKTYAKNKSQVEIAREAEEHRRFVRDELLDGKDYCGRQHTDDYFYDKTETAVDEFPWMVYIPYFTAGYVPEGRSFCVGVLINSRYVLTAQECLDNGVIETVRLGEHHIYINSTCVEDCPTPMEVPVHSFDIKFLPHSRLVLLRLKNTVYYSDYIRPICLPLDSPDMVAAPAKISTSGWGKAAQFLNGRLGNYVNVKKRIVHRGLKSDQCEGSQTINNPICGTTLDNAKDYDCRSDVGGPLMYKHESNWFVGGIITGIASCDLHQGSVLGEQITPDTIDQILSIIER